MPSRDSSQRSSIEDRLRAFDARGGEPSADVAAVVADGRSGKRLKSGTVVVLLMVGVALVGLYSMRSLGSASANGGLSREIETLIAGVLPDAGGTFDMEAVMEMPEVDDAAVFAMLDTDFRGRLQVAWDDLARDPFQPWQDPAAASTAVPGLPIAVELGAAAGEAWAREIDRIVEMLELKSLIGGGSAAGMANVNGRIIRRGDVFSVAEAEADFRVVAIERDGVRLKVVHPRLGVERDAFLQVRRPF